MKSNPDDLDTHTVRNSTTNIYTINNKSRLLPPIFKEARASLLSKPDLCKDPCGALVVVLTVRSKWFTVHDPPQWGHPSYPPLGVDADLPLWTCWTLVGARLHLRGQWTCTHLGGSAHTEFHVAVAMWVNSDGFSLTHLQSLTQ
ncbi:hypothetical protein INR49_019794 [Caranx melampygus]|nr:hypothetical protein INR49_019794 [Caranx melampygus]